LLFPHAPNLKYYGVPRIRAGVSGHVWIVQPGKVGPIAHGEHFGQKAIEGADAHLALYSLAVKDHLVAYLMPGGAMPFLPDHFGHDFESFIPSV
jgi:hypothetical protein